MDTKEAIKKFNDRINEFFSSRLIIVERTISKLLECLVSNPILYGVIEESSKSCFYDVEYKNATAEKDGVGGYFTLPSGRRQVIILVTGLLFEFDNKNISIVDFVTKFYPNESSHHSYMEFCDKVITPFSEAYKFMLEGEPKLLSEVIAKEMAIIPFADKAKEDADFWLRSLLDIVIGDNSLAEPERREYITMVKGLLYVLEGRNPMLIKIVWIGLRNTMGNYKAGFRELKEMETVFKSYGVID